MLNEGFQSAFLACVVLAGIGLALALLLLGRPRGIPQEQVELEPSPAPAATERSTTAQASARRVTVLVKGRFEMTEVDSLFSEEHVRRYREINGEVGHIWHGGTVLQLTTNGRSSGEPRTTPVAYDRVGDDFLVLATNGGRALIQAGTETSPKSRETTIQGGPQ